MALAMVSVEVTGVEFAETALYHSVYTLQQLSWQRSCCGISQDRFARDGWKRDEVDRFSAEIALKFQKLLLSSNLVKTETNCDQFHNQQQSELTKLWGWLEIQVNASHITCIWMWDSQIYTIKWTGAVSLHLHSQRLLICLLFLAVPAGKNLEFWWQVNIKVWQAKCEVSKNLF